MPFNKEVFKTRAISAFFFVIIMMTGLLWNIWSFLALFMVIHAGCWAEYAKLSAQIANNRYHTWVVLGVIAAGMAVILRFGEDAYMVDGYSLRTNLTLPLSLAGFLLLAAGLLHRNTLITMEGFARLALGWLYLSFSLGTFISLRLEGYDFMGTGTDLGYILPLLLMGSIWINDTMAYLVGSFFGKTPLSAISPKKTWEGTIGGALLAIVIMAVIARFGFETDWKMALTIPLIGAVAGTLGDLLESKLKRMAHVKDSGSMMPGHGGFLDRFDSLLLAAPVAWLFLRVFG